MITTAKIAVANFEEVKAQFLLGIKVSVEMDEISPALVINLDQISIHYVSAGSRTMEKEGGRDGCSWQQKTDNSRFCWDPKWWFFTTTGHLQRHNTSLPAYHGVYWRLGYHSCRELLVHWEDHDVEKILLQYVKKPRSEMKLQEDQRALLIFDQFKGQVTEKINV